MGPPWAGFLWHSAPYVFNPYDVTPIMTQIWDRLTYLLFLLVAALVALTFRDYGLSWDEPFHIEYGERLLRYYTSGGADSSAFSYINLYLYGGLFDAPVALLAKWLPFELAESRHLLIATTGLLGLVGTWRLARLLAGSRAGFFAALLLITMPGWYGHLFINPKDIPFATTMVWASYALARLARHLPDSSWRDWLFFGVCGGMAMGMRIGGVLIVGYLGLALMLWFLATLCRPAARHSLLHDSVALLPKLLLAAVVAYGVMVAVWPWALSSPLRHPYEAMTTFSHFPVIIPTQVDGVWINSDALPVFYLPLMMAIKLPLLQLLLLAVLPLFAGRIVHWARQPESAGDTRWLSWAVVVIALFLPLLYAIVSSPGMYNEMRHFLFLLPPLAILAGVGGDLVWGYLQRRAPIQRVAVLLMVVIYLGLHVATLVRLHPYEYIYYNPLVGGVKGAEKRFELDYWSTSQRELYTALKQYLRDNGGEAALHQPWRIRLCGAPEAALYYHEPEWTTRWIGEQGDADFEVGITGNICPPPRLPATIEVRRDGALLGYVNDLRGP